jgi:hypothetical protein
MELAVGMQSDYSVVPVYFAQLHEQISMVEAAGVEPVISTENTQVTETENA